MTHPDPTAIAFAGVGARFGKTWALRDITARFPTGSVIALVGTNGAGKTSLIRLSVGLVKVSEGSIQIFGERLDPRNPVHLARVGYVSQRKALYGSLSVHEMLRYGRLTNPDWDQRFATRRVNDLGIDPAKRIRQLSAGQRTQVAITMAMAKRPRLLAMDEPMADLDPLARKRVLSELMADVAERGTTVIVSSHILSELEAPCDHVLAIDSGRTLLAGEIATILDEHLLLTGPSDALSELERHGTVVDQSRTGSSARALIRITSDSRFLNPQWRIQPARLDTVVLGYMRSRRAYVGSAAR